MHGRGVEFLDFSFQKLSAQSYKDFEVIISDHSIDNGIEELCRNWSGELDIRYYKNEHGIGKSSANLNFALTQCRGKWIKIIFQDDFLLSDEALAIIKKRTEENQDTSWLVTACEHTQNGIDLIRPFYPKWNDQIHLGMNTISSPSVLCLRNKEKLFFNEDLVWLMDVDYYHRMHAKHGEPDYLNEILVVNRIWDKSVSNTLSEEAKNKELQIITESPKTKIGGAES